MPPSARRRGCIGTMPPPLCRHACKHPEENTASGGQFEREDNRLIRQPRSARKTSTGACGCACAERMTKDESKYERVIKGTNENMESDRTQTSERTNERTNDK